MADFSHCTSRRGFLKSTGFAVAAAASSKLWVAGASAIPPPKTPLGEFSYRDVAITSELHENQLHQTHAVLMGLDDDSLLKPLRRMAGQPAPGFELGGWYLYDPDYDYRTFGAAFAPACTFGQWVSALARMYAITGSQATREKVLRLNRLYAQTISGDFYVNNRFPAYCYDKIVCGLLDSHRWVGDPDAFAIMGKTTDAALPHLPGKAIEHDDVWRPGKDISYTWDESYTISENLFLAYQRGAGERYRKLAEQYLDERYYGPLAEGRNVLGGRHAYSYVNSLSSAMQAYFTLGSEKHLRAARNAFDMLVAQSFATGAWGPDEQLRRPGSPDLAASLSKTHSSFETPCGSYAHFKLTRYLLRATRDSRFGDSMEQVMYNTVLGAKPLEPDGRTFYYSDYNFNGRKFYCDHRWPCCSGTLPQVAADYRINTYFRDPQGVYVNLYIPSIVRWAQNRMKVALTQRGGYPFEQPVLFEVDVSRPVEFALHFRIPAWAERSELFINGKHTSEPLSPGSFASIRREWRRGDRCELSLPMTTRLQPIDAQHPDTVALRYGPLVLFAIAPSGPVTRSQLLAAKQISRDRWQVETMQGALLMLPFVSIDQEQYSTYLQVE